MHFNPFIESSRSKPEGAQALESTMNDDFRSKILASQIGPMTSTLPGLDLLNRKLVFGTAWFWTLPEVHNVQEEIDALRSQFRRYIGVRDT